MKMIIVIGLIISLSTPFTAESKSPTQQINVFHNDITGDSTQETIRLNGTLLTSDSKYYKDIWMDISNAKGEKRKISLQGGYSPHLNFRDLTHNGETDILYQSQAEKDDELYNYSLHTMKNNQMEKIELPEKNYLTAEYKEDFKVAVNLNHKQEPIIMNISNQSEKYINHNIYQKNGKLIQNSSPVISPITHFDLIKLKNSKGYGLKSYQEIGGVNPNDSKLGTVETLWQYEDGQWIILNSNWKPHSSFK